MLCWRLRRVQPFSEPFVEQGACGAMKLDELEKKIGSVGEADLDTLWTALVEFTAERGVKRIACHHLPPIGSPDAGVLRFANSGFPEGAVERYLRERKAGNTPIAFMAQSRTVPIYWDEIDKLKSLTPTEREYLQAAREEGLVNGCGLQVFGPNGRNGFFALGFGSVRRLPANDMREIQLACQSAHLAYCAFLLDSMGAPPDLSAREAEVLGWVAQGKSNAVIGDILGISAHTVDAHLRKIYLKLGVFDRITAALRGLGFGLIYSSR